MSAEYGYSTPLRLPNLMSSYDYLSLYNEADWNSNGNPRANYTAPVSDADLEKYRSGVDPDLYPDADWMVCYVITPATSATPLTSVVVVTAYASSYQVPTTHKTVYTRGEEERRLRFKHQFRPL